MSREQPYTRPGNRGWRGYQAHEARQWLRDNPKERRRIYGGKSDWAKKQEEKSDEDE